MHGVSLAFLEKQLLRQDSHVEIREAYASGIYFKTCRNIFPQLYASQPASLFLSFVIWLG